MSSPYRVVDDVEAPHVLIEDHAWPVAFASVTIT
jgi:hypothetical protein